MKQFRKLALLLALLLGLSACGGESDELDDKTEEGNHESSKQEETVDVADADDYIVIDYAGGSNGLVIQENHAAGKHLVQRLEVNYPRLKYCVSVPEGKREKMETGYQFISDAYSIVFDHYVEGVSDTQFGVSGGGFDRSNQVLEKMKKQVLATFSNALDKKNCYDFEIDTKLGAMRNGHNMCRYEGRVLFFNDDPGLYQDTRFVSYGFLEDGYPIYFAVIENPENGKDRDLDIGGLADEIAWSFRDCPND